MTLIASLTPRDKVPCPGGRQNRRALQWRAKLREERAASAPKRERQPAASSKVAGVPPSLDELLAEPAVQWALLCAAWRDWLSRSPAEIELRLCVAARLSAPRELSLGDIRTWRRVAARRLAGVKPEPDRDGQAARPRLGRERAGGGQDRGQRLRR